MTIDRSRPARFEGASETDFSITMHCQTATDKVVLGDHTVFAAEVVDAGHRREDKPLEVWPTHWFYGG